MTTFAFVLGVMLALVGLLQSMSQSLFDIAPSVPIALLSTGCALVAVAVIAS